MEDEDKTKEQLIRELVEMRQRIAALETSEALRKRVQEVLRDSEERYRAIFEQAADSIVLVDAETGALVEFNDRAHENLGYTREEFEKLKIPEFEVVESVEEVAKHIEKIIKEGSDIFETKHRKKDGEIRDILVSSRAISIGGRDFVQSVWHDVTEHKRAEEALRRKATLDGMRVSVYEMREASDIQSVLASLYEALKNIGVEFDHCSVQIVDEEKGCFAGYYLDADRVHQRIERPLRDSAVYEAWRDKQAIYRRDLDEEDPYNEKIITIRDRDVRSVLDVSFSRGTIAINSVRSDAFSEGDIETLKECAGVLSQAYTRFEDIRRIEESEERYRSIVEHSPDVIFRLDLARNYLLISPVVQKLTGYSPEEFYADRTIGRRIVLSEDFEQAEEGFRKAGSGEASRDVAYRVRTKDGKILWMSQNTFPVRDAGGRIVAIEGSIRDITDRKLLQEERESLRQQAFQSSRLAAIGELAAGFAHEISNPLTGVIGFSELLLEQPLDPEIRSDLEKILRDGRKAQKVVEDLLRFSRGQRAQEGYFGLNEAIEDTVKLVRRQFRWTTSGWWRIWMRYLSGMGTGDNSSRYS